MRNMGMVPARCEPLQQSYERNRVGFASTRGRVDMGSLAQLFMRADVFPKQRTV
jgi:hypothetical protein